MILVNAPTSNRRLTLTVIDLAEGGQLILCQQKDDISTYLFITPAGIKSIEELTIDLKAALTEVTLTAIHEPILEEELIAVRKIFADAGLDSGGVSDDELATFIQSKVKGEYFYCIDMPYHDKNKIHIILTKDLPELAPGYVDNVECKEIYRKVNGDEIEVMVELSARLEAHRPPPPKRNQ